MSDHEAFMRMIVENPEDDVPRLVYADYLEEHGEADRAEFIRIQCELAKTPEYESPYAQLWGRETALLTLHREEWELAIPLSQSFRQGFIDHLTLTNSEFLTYVPRLIDKVPLRSFRFRDFPYSIQHFLDTPLLSGIRSLDLSEILHDTLLVGTPDPISLPLIHQLRVRRNGMNAASIAQWGNYLRFPSLELLDLSDNPLGIAGIEQLVHSPSIGNLTDLRLENRTRMDYPVLIRAPGANAVAFSPHLTHLQRLDLGGQMIGDSGIAFLARSPFLRNLVWLDLWNNDIGSIGSTGLESLSELAAFPKLKVLRLGHNPIGPLGLDALMSWPQIRELRILDLSSCSLKDRDISRMIQFDQWHPELNLVLYGNSLTDSSLKKLMDRWPKTNRGIRGGRWIIESLDEGNPIH